MAEAQGERPAEPEALVFRTADDDIRQSGRWAVPQRIVAESRTGTITIDFTRATCAYDEVEVEAVTRAGWIGLILPAGWAARISPASTEPQHIDNKAASTADPGAPTVVVSAHPGLGGVTVRQERRRRR
jgi:hypothetical protein